MTTLYVSETIIKKLTFSRVFCIHKSYNSAARGGCGIISIEAYKRCIFTKPVFTDVNTRYAVARQKTFGEEGNRADCITTAIYMIFILRPPAHRMDKTCLRYLSVYYMRADIMRLYNNRANTATIFYLLCKNKNLFEKSKRTENPWTNNTIIIYFIFCWCARARFYIYIFLPCVRERKNLKSQKLL